MKILPNDHFIRPSQIQSITGLSRTTIWRLETKGQFPKRTQISIGAVAWKWSEVKAWMDSR